MVNISNLIPKKIVYGEILLYAADQACKGLRLEKSWKNLGTLTTKVQFSQHQQLPPFVMHASFTW